MDNKIPKAVPASTTIPIELGIVGGISICDRAKSCDNKIKFNGDISELEEVADKWVIMERDSKDRAEISYFEGCLNLHKGEAFLYSVAIKILRAGDVIYYNRTQD